MITVRVCLFVCLFVCNSRGGAGVFREEFKGTIFTLVAYSPCNIFYRQIPGIGLLARQQSVVSNLDLLSN